MSPNGETDDRLSGVSFESSDSHPAVVVARFLLRGVWIDHLLLGRVATWSHQEHSVTLRLPSQPTDFTPLENDDTPPIPAVAGTATIDGTGSPISVHIIEVEVQVDSVVSSETKERALAARADGDEAPIEEFQRWADEAWRQGFEIAKDAAHAWLQHVRVISGQPWLGAAVEPPFQHGRSSIIDATSRITLMQFGPPQSLAIRHGSLALNPDQFERVRVRVGAAARPPVAEQLLADARFLTGEAPTKDHQRAILSAAAACEIKAKQAIRVATSVGRKPLTEIVLRRTSNLSDLLDQVSLASVGRSLKTEDLDLFKRIQRLTQARNSVIHEGIQVSELDGHELTVAATQLFDWLDDLVRDTRGHIGT